MTITHPKSFRFEIFLSRLPESTVTEGHSIYLYLSIYIYIYIYIYTHIYIIEIILMSIFKYFYRHTEALHAFDWLTFGLSTCFIAKIIANRVKWQRSVLWGWRGQNNEREAADERRDNQEWPGDRGPDITALEPEAGRLSGRAIDPLCCSRANWMLKVSWDTWHSVIYMMLSLNLNSQLSYSNMIIHLTQLHWVKAISFVTLLQFL